MTHIRKALDLYPNEDALQFRASLMTPAVFESEIHLSDTRDLLENRIDALYESAHSGHLTIETLNEFVMSPTFYFVYQGRTDKDLLTKLHTSYSLAHPILSRIEVQPPIDPPIDRQALRPSAEVARKIRVGFVSSHFRRHSICKLFCGIITHLNSSLFDVYVFSSLQETKEDQLTNQLRKKKSVEYVSIGSTYIPTRPEVLKRGIDILVYLDVGMDPSTSVWAASRLAPVQVCTWGHPTTTGLASIDYFLSSYDYHAPLPSPSALHTDLPPNSTGTETGGSSSSLPYPH